MAWHGIALSIIVPLQLYDVVPVSLCRSFVTRGLASLQDEESARTLGVLHVDGRKERLNNVHTAKYEFNRASLPPRITPESNS